MNKGYADLLQLGKRKFEYSVCLFVRSFPGWMAGLSSRPVARRLL